MEVGTIIVITVAFVFLIWIISKTSKSGTRVGALGGVSVAQVLSHWANSFSFFSLSANDFYTALEESFKLHDMPDVKIARANNKEGGIFSASREYLRIKHRDLVFDICAAPFGKDFFVSWWMYETEGLVRQFLKHTKAGDYLNQRAARRTFFQADEEAMFRSCVHNVVIEVVDKMAESRGTRALTELEKAIQEGGM